MPMAQPKWILFTVMAFEGFIQDRVTARFYNNSAVKCMPMGVLITAACLPEKYEFTLPDAASRGLSVDETIEEVEAHGSDILGFSVVTCRAWTVTRILDRCSAPIKAVGGPYAKHNHKAILHQGAHEVFVDDKKGRFDRDYRAEFCANWPSPSSLSTL